MKKLLVGKTVTAYVTEFSDKFDSKNKIVGTHTFKIIEIGECTFFKDSDIITKDENEKLFIINLDQNIYIE